MDTSTNLPPHVNYWITASSKNDCFFVVGPESGPTERIGALKIFLLAVSEPMRNMLEDSELAETGDIRIIDTSPQTMKTFLKCVYGGSHYVLPTLSFQESTDLLYLIEKYLVINLQSIVVQHLFQRLSLDNVVIAISNPVCFQQPILKEAILKLVKENTDVIMNNENLFQLTCEGLLWIIKQNPLNISELELCEAVFKWAKHHVEIGNAESARTLIGKHLKYIRFCTLDCEDFCAKVVPADILTPDEVFEICRSLGSRNAPETNTICKKTMPRRKTLVTIPKPEMDFYHVVNNVKHLKRENSINFNFDNHSWKIFIVKRNYYLGLFLKWNIDIDPQPNILSDPEVEADIVLINQSGGTDLCKKVSHVFTEMQSDWGFSCFCHWYDVIDPKCGFIKNNTIIVKVHLKL